MRVWPSQHSERKYITLAFFHRGRAPLSRGREGEEIKVMIGRGPVVGRKSKRKNTTFRSQLYSK